MISPLQLGLIGLGTVFILGLVIFNWWQERKIRRDMVRRFDGPIDDVLMGGTSAAMVEEETAYIKDEPRNEEVSEYLPMEDEPEPAIANEEPHFSSEFDETEFTDSADLDEHVDDDVEPVSTIAPLEKTEAPVEKPIEAVVPVESAVPAAPTEPTPSLPPGVDATIDEIAVLSPAQPCTGSSLRSSLNPLADFGKPVRWFGWSQDAWLPLTREFEQKNFSRIVGALQLADRSGPVQADGLLGFQDQVENLSAQIGGTLTWLEQREALRYASLLDQFCIEVDVTVSMHVTAGVEGPFAGTKLRGLAEAAGLTLKDDGRYHQLSDSGETLYTLSSADQRPITEDSLRTSMMHDVVLMLDVPRVSKGGEVFRHMAMFGARLETALNARLTDANRRALGEAQIEQIRTQIQTIHSKMQERQIIPGGATALRLFS